MRKREDLKAVAGPAQAVPIEVWREGEVVRRELAPGRLGVVIDPRPAPDAIAEQRNLRRVLVAARSGDEDFVPLPGTRYEVEELSRIFLADHRSARILLGPDASEPELDRLAGSGELGRYSFIHLATHGVIDETFPVRTAVILTQIGLPDPLEQALKNRPVFDGRVSVREIQRGWALNAELVTLSACETALGRDAGGEGFVGFTQALLISGARSLCLSLWKVDDTATALLMQRFYANLLGRRAGLTAPMPKAEALREAKAWLRGLGRSEAMAVTATLSGGVDRGKGTKGRAAERERRPDPRRRRHRSSLCIAALLGCLRAGGRPGLTAFPRRMRTVMRGQRMVVKLGLLIGLGLMVSQGSAPAQTASPGDRTTLAGVAQAGRRRRAVGRRS